MTSSSPCPYLPAREEQRLLTFLDSPAKAQALPLLLQNGFRRSQHMAYRPACAQCQACKSVRIRLADFALGKSERRVLRKNAALRVAHAPAVATDDLFQLFTRYQTARHAQSEMAQMTRHDFAQMIEEHTGHARLMLAEEEGRTIAAMLYDALPDGRSAVYSFFDPLLHARSLGSWMILHMAQETRAAGKEYLYLGYWVAGSPKMDYKAQFRPLEIFSGTRWVPFNP